MPKFLREILSYVLIAAIAFSAGRATTPGNVLVSTVTEAETAPAYAQKYLDAICSFDAKYLEKNTSPDFAGPEQIAEYIASAVAADWGCESTKYLGSYQLGDTQAFSVVVLPSGNEVFYLFTFDAEQLVTNIE